VDPITQGALGASFAQSRASGNRFYSAGLLGAFAGMAPDLDVFISSSTDPLLFLEYHRQFTHSLVFIPIGALLCALIGYYFARRHLSFAQTYAFCLLGYATHALLDACTSYGTLLFWPFSYVRIDWSNVSVVDPLLTLPLLLAVVLSIRRQRQKFALYGIGWVIAYLMLGVVQRERAETVAHQLAEQRNLPVQSLAVKPAFANLLLWRAIVETADYYYIDAVRVGWQTSVISGGRLVKLDRLKQFAWLDPASQQAKDLSRFDWFSQGYLAVHPHQANTVMDARYAMLPNGLDSMWQVTLDPHRDPQSHIAYAARRDTSAHTLQRFYSMLVAGHDPGPAL